MSATRYEDKCSLSIGFEWPVSLFKAKKMAVDLRLRDSRSRNIVFGAFDDDVRYGQEMDSSMRRLKKLKDATVFLSKES